MARFGTEWRKYLIGAVIMCCMLLGGGAAPGSWTDTLLQLLIVAAAVPILAARDGETVDRSVLWLCGLILAAMLVQLLPVPAEFIQPFRSELLTSGRLEARTDGFEFISLGLGRTVEATLYVAVLVMLLLALLRLPGQQLHALLPFLLAGVACNAIAGLIQYSATSGVAINGYLPFTITAGFFANRNHFATLLYAALPFLVYFATFRGTRLWAFASIILILLVLLAAGSRAGVFLGLAALVLSVAFFVTRSRIGIGSFLVVTVVLGAYALGTWNIMESRGMTDAFRRQFSRTTLAGIEENWLLGIGYGNFPSAYPIYQDQSDIFTYYVNHAHNEYLELIFEGGILSLLLIILYIIILSLKAISIIYVHFTKSAFLGIVFIMIHSMMDYPLRTMAIAVMFVYFNAVLFHNGLKPGGRYIKGLVEVSDGSKKKLVPVKASGFVGFVATADWKRKEG